MVRRANWGRTQFLRAALVRRIAVSATPSGHSFGNAPISRRNAACTPRSVPSNALRRGELVRIRDQRWAIAETVPHPDATVVTVVGCDRSNRGSRARYLLPFE